MELGWCRFKAGPLLCLTHGIGNPSISVVLHETAKLLHYAKAQNVVFLRLGTCGGLGLPAGTLVVSREAWRVFILFYFFFKKNN